MQIASTNVKYGLSASIEWQLYIKVYSNKEKAFELRGVFKDITKHLWWSCFGEIVKGFELSSQSSSIIDVW